MKKPVFLFFAVCFLLVGSLSCAKVEEDDETSELLSGESAPELLSSSGSTETFPSLSGLVEKQKHSVVNISTTSVVKRGPMFPDFGEGDVFRGVFQEIFPERPGAGVQEKGAGLRVHSQQKRLHSNQQPCDQQGRRYTGRSLRRVEVYGRDCRTGHKDGSRGAEDKT